MKTSFENLSKVPCDTFHSFMFYGLEEGYLRFCAQQLTNQLQRIKKLTIHRCTQAQLLEQPDILTPQIELFAMKNQGKIVIVEDMTDKGAALIENFFKYSPKDIYLILTCATSASVRRLRQIYEIAQTSVFISCYLDTSAAKIYYLNTLLNQYQLQLTPEATVYLLHRIEHDPNTLADDLLKLQLYLGKSKEPATLKELKQCCEDVNEGDMSLLLGAIGDKEKTRYLKIYHQILSSGVDRLFLLRAFSSYFVRLLVLHAKTSEGMSAQQALSSIRPPIFYKHYDMYKRHLQNWNSAQIIVVLNTLKIAERTFKSVDSETMVKIDRFLAGLLEI